MLRTKRNQAVDLSGVVSSALTLRNNDVHHSLSFEDTALAVPCANVRGRAILTVTVRKSGGRRGNLRSCVRRTVATSRYARGVSFGGSRIHGIVAPSFIMGAFRPQFLTGSRAGGFRACRNRTRGISTPHGLPSPWKGRADHPSVFGAFAMMRTSTRSVSTAFPSVPEPVFSPVESRRDRDDHAHRVNTFTDLANEAEAILARCVDALKSSSTMAPASHACDRAFISSYLAGLIDFCKEIEAIPSRSFTVEA